MIYVRILITIFILENPIPLIGQENFSSNPLQAQFITEDVHRFWEAFDKMDTLGVKAFEVYIDQGTVGLKVFNENAQDLYKTVLERKDDYLKSKSVLDTLDNERKQIQSIYSTMKYWYPETIFPPVYFVVGRFMTGGTITKDGIILGTEMLENLDGLAGLVAHELIHFQQSSNKKTLLGQSLDEGAADFIGELISGENTNVKIFDYAEMNIERLCKEFVFLMDRDDISDWLYGTTGKYDRPNDLGYWIGYRIVASYFNKQDFFIRVQPTEPLETAKILENLVSKKTISFENTLTVINSNTVRQKKYNAYQQSEIIAR